MLWTPQKSIYLNSINTCLKMKIVPLSNTTVDHEVKNQLVALFRQLNAHITPLDVEEVLNQGNEFIMYCAWNERRLIGMASLATYKVVSGYKGIVEDVVVAADWRGKGLGRKLMGQLVAHGEQLGLKELLLFSGHHRTPAISLYKSMGFKKKQSGMYTRSF